MTVLQWSRVSDRVGRKPVILSGLFGLCISMYCFGLSKTFWGLVLSRSLNGALSMSFHVKHLLFLTSTLRCRRQHWRL